MFKCAQVADDFASVADTPLYKFAESDQGWVDGHNQTVQAMKLGMLECKVYDTATGVQIKIIKKTNEMIITNIDNERSKNMNISRTLHDQFQHNHLYAYFFIFLFVSIFILICISILFFIIMIIVIVYLQLHLVRFLHTYY